MFVIANNNNLRRRMLQRQFSAAWHKQNLL